MKAETCRGQLAKIRFFKGNSEAFRLVRHILMSGRCRCSHSASERMTISRLVRAGLVVPEKEATGSCRSSRVCYSLTLVGKASYAAAELGLSFSQLCYLACARAAARNSIFGEPLFYAKDLNPIFSMLFPDISPAWTRVILSRRRFLERYVNHVYSLTPRFEAYGEIADELYTWIKSEYAARLSESLQDPAVASMLLPTSRQPQTKVRGKDEGA